MSFISLATFLLVLDGTTSVFSFSPPSVQTPGLALSSSSSPAFFSSSALHLTTDDDVQQLLARARALREEAAVMSGKTIEEMEQEVKHEKKLALERQSALEKTRREQEESHSAKTRRDMRILPLPENSQAQIQQAASAIERAFADGIVRQTVRFALLVEEEAMTGELNEWPGGAKQMYRESGRPLTESLLREIRAYSKELSSVAGADEPHGTTTSTRMPPVVTAEEIWDFDGSAIVSAQAAGGSHGDVKAVVFPNTDTKYLKDIESIDKDVGPNRLLLLINPFWKNVESWGFNILAPNAKKRAQEVIFDNGYEVTYAVLRFSARGEDCVALKSYPHDWQLYAFREDPSSWFNQEVPIWLGSSKEEPSYSQFTELLNSRSEFKMSKNMRQMQRMMGNDDQ